MLSVYQIIWFKWYTVIGARSSCYSVKWCLFVVHEVWTPLAVQPDESFSCVHRKGLTIFEKPWKFAIEIQRGLLPQQHWVDIHNSLSSESERCFGNSWDSSSDFQSELQTLNYTTLKSKVSTYRLSSFLSAWHAWTANTTVTLPGTCLWRCQCNTPNVSYQYIINIIDDILIQYIDSK